MMKLTALQVASLLILGLTTRSISANTWGISRTITSFSQQRNPWLSHGIARKNELQGTDSILQQQKYVVSIRGGSSATGKYLLCDILPLRC
jgi:ribosomal protein S6E (S10)